MKYNRVVIPRSGGPEVLKVVEEEIPEPRPGEARVKILAAGVAYVDLFLREGLYPGAPRKPFTPGFDIVGIVDKSGEGLSTVRPGERVAALTRFGGYAEFICLSEEKLVPVPRGLDPAEADCLVLNYVTAHQLLHRAAQVKSGERILIHGAGGGVGTALLQLGKMAGLEMYGTASRAKHEVVSQLGGIPIDYRTEDFVERIRHFTGDGVDAVFDPIGGTNWRRSFQTLRKGGRLVPYGASSLLSEGKLKTALGLLDLLFLKLFPKGRKVMRMFGTTARPYSSPELCRKDLSMLFDLLAQVRIKPVIAERIPLLEAARAHELLGKKAVTGKLVLICNAF
jgi:NADPH:quinone reductase